jgi:transcription antitermination factor NusG
MIPDSFIAGLRSCSIQKDEHQWRLDPGTIVKIERGPFAEMTGTIVSWSGADRVRLLVWMLGRETLVEVHGADINAVA